MNIPILRCWLMPEQLQVSEVVPHYVSTVQIEIFHKFHMMSRIRTRESYFDFLFKLVSSNVAITASHVFMKNNAFLEPADIFLSVGRSSLLRGKVRMRKISLFTDSEEKQCMSLECIRKRLITTVVVFFRHQWRYTIQS